MQHPNSIPDLIKLWPSRRALADDVGDTVDNVHKWAQTGRIPAWKQASVLAAARERGIAIDGDWMVQAHAERGTAA